VLIESHGRSDSEDAKGTGNQSHSRQDVAVLGEFEMRALPGPKHAAMVHIQDGIVAGGKPFLVDLTGNGDALFAV
jgi:hypothetical protein